MCNRILCPPSDISTNERIKTIIYHEFKKWIMTPELVQLVKVYNNNENPPISLPYFEYLDWLKDFIQIWDFRKRQSSAITKEGEAARWLLENDNIVEQHSDLIFAASVKLGLIGITDIILENPDFILPLGGAGISNFKRCDLAKFLIDTHKFKTKVVALSTMRPLSQMDMDYYADTIAKDALFEFDAISYGITSTFNISSYTDNSKKFENRNQDSVIREYEDLYKGNKIYAIAAPSSDPNRRRANSTDCFNFFFKNFDIKSHSEIINCTSQIYCSYQQVRALSFAINHKVNFDTVGFPTNQDQTKLLNEPVNYLQEIKGTIDAIYDFLCEFSQIICR